MIRHALLGLVSSAGRGTPIAMLMNANFSARVMISVAVLASGATARAQYYNIMGFWKTQGTQTISYVQATPKARVSGFVASISATFAATPTPGNAIIVYVWGWKNAAFNFTTTGCTDNNGNTYTLAVSNHGLDGSGNPLDVAIYYATNISASGTFTVTVTPSTSTEMVLAAVEYSGVAKTNALDRTAVNNGFSSTASTGTTGAVMQNRELFAAVLNEDYSSTATITPSGSYTSRVLETDGANYQAGQGVDQIVTTGGTASASWTVTSTYWRAAIATFRAGP